MKIKFYTSPYETTLYSQTLSTRAKISAIEKEPYLYGNTEYRTEHTLLSEQLDKLEAKLQHCIMEPRS